MARVPTIRKRFINICRCQEPQRPSSKRLREGGRKRGEGEDSGKEKCRGKGEPQAEGIGGERPLNASTAVNAHHFPTRLQTAHRLRARVPAPGKLLLQPKHTHACAQLTSCGPWSSQDPHTAG